VLKVAIILSDYINLVADAFHTKEKENVCIARG